jgi:hypothetical protein
MSALLLYSGSILIILWGIAHVVPTRAVVESFGPLSLDNKRILAMEWVAEGLTLSFIGVLTLLVTLQSKPSDAVAVFVFRASAFMLVVMAGWTLMTGSRTSVVPIKICPFVKTTAALLLILGTLL